MRSLRSRTNIQVSDNKSDDMCNKRSKPAGGEKAPRKRQVLADLEAKETPEGRPRRTPNLPLKYQHHELSPLKGCRPHCSSTPLPTATEKVTSHKTKSTRNVSADVKVTKMDNQTNNQRPKVTKKETTNNSEETTPLKSTGKRPINTNKTVKTVTPMYKKVFKEAAQKDADPKVATPLYKKSVILLEKPKIPTPDRMALYEFDFDPKEEPTQAKKKKNKKKPAGTKKKTNKINSAKDEADLQALIERLKKIQEKQKCKKLLENKKKLQEKKYLVPEIHIENITTTTKSNIPQASTSDKSMIECLSPIPKRTSRPPSTLGMPIDYENCTPNLNASNVQTSIIAGSPVASSSMIVKSARKPATPWRVDCELGNRKWPLNIHVKPSMTPSFERDTVHIFSPKSYREQNSMPEQRRHVYTNMFMNPTDDDEDQSQKKIPNWKQTSILSFYEESLKKTAKKRSLSPKKAVESYDFDDLVPETNELCNSLDETSKSAEKSTGKEIQKAAVENCFGFDDTEEFDDENVSPAKVAKLQNINTVRGTFKCVKKRTALKEINTRANKNVPTRVLPADVLNIIEQHKFMEDIGAEPRKDPAEEKLPQPTNYQNSSDNEDAEQMNSDEEMEFDEESLPSEGTEENQLELFAEPNEPEVVHFSKPTRRSYGTRKRGQVNFILADATTDCNKEPDTDFDRLASIPKKPRKVTKKKKKNAKNKKQEKEADDWMASFNSMLEECDEFPLCVE